jgi:hypothetical protein
MTGDRRLINALLRNVQNEESPLVNAVRSAQPPQAPLSSMFGSSFAPGPSNALASFLTPPPLPDTSLNSLASLLQTQVPIFAVATPTAPAAPVVRAAPVRRMAYFAFDFDDVIRVNNVRQTGKIGFRVSPHSRGFLDRSVWESRKINTSPGLKQLMQQAMKFSSVVCVLVGTNTWFSRWVRYEIAQAVVGERGLFAIDLNSIDHNHRKAPDLLGVNPLNFMGVRKDERGAWHLVERLPVELEKGNVGFEWHWYQDYQPPVPRPKFIPEIQAGAIVPLSAYTRRYDFMPQEGSKNIGGWLDTAATEVGR